MNRCVLFCYGCCFVFFSYGQNCLELDYKLRGYFYAGSKINDSLVPGGYYADDNYPKPMSPYIFKDINTEQVQLIVEPELITNAAQDIPGFKVFLINGTSDIQALPAQDSRLYIKRQVFYKGAWVDIEYLPSSWCGNSYHELFIKPYQYWEFVVPFLKGKIEAKFRFELYISDDLTVYSNEFEGSFNEVQLERKQGYTPKNFMDPYND
ncbi:MAG: hypothetical protein HRU26_00635 [Psychroserpens sp.]|nr:hypothetical protein [Psychroserpens sp.]